MQLLVDVGRAGHAISTATSLACHSRESGNPWSNVPVCPTTLIWLVGQAMDSRVRGNDKVVAMRKIHGPRKLVACRSAAK
jgi:hypothetical protein